jgi:glycerophosphoryl diester phosphodiesterase
MAFYLEHGMDPESIIDSYSILIPDYTYHAADAIRLLSEHGKKIFPWTVNDPGIVKAMKEAGCSGIITDFADRMLLPED